MAHTYEELKKKTVAEMREIAQGLDQEAVKGYTQLNKEHLLVVLCKALQIDTREHHQVIGLEKTKVKGQIRDLKKKREEAMAAHDHGRLKDIRHQIHRLKRKIHQATK